MTLTTLNPVSRTGIFHILFAFIFSALTLVVTVQSLISNTSLHSLLSISPSNFVSDHQRKPNSACIQSHNVANTTLELQRTARFKTKEKQQDYLIVRQNDRTRNPLQDRRIGTIAHQRTYQGITFQGIHRDA